MHPLTPYRLPSIHCIATRGESPHPGDTRLPDPYQPTMPLMVNTIFYLYCEQQIAGGNHRVRAKRPPCRARCVGCWITRLFSIRKPSTFGYQIIVHDEYYSFIICNFQIKFVRI
jgi:hypothetical protein